MSTYISVDHAPFGSYSAELGLWTVRRIGWCLGVQPAIFGLILLSRREWVTGGVALGVAALCPVLVEVLTARPSRRSGLTRDRLDHADQRALAAVEHAMQENAEIISGRAEKSGSTNRGLEHARRISESSLLNRVTALLPGYSRLPSECRVPLESQRIDDGYRSELASRTRPDLRQLDRDGTRTSDRDGEGRDTEEASIRASVDGTFYDPVQANRGLVYPFEMLLPKAVVWLPAGREFEVRAAELESEWGLPAIVDLEDEGARQHKKNGQSAGF